MALTDTNGRAYKRTTDLKVGDRVEVDSGFTCITSGRVRIVEHSDDGFYIRCHAGRHYLDGQEDYRDGTDALIGIYPARSH